MTTVICTCRVADYDAFRPGYAKALEMFSDMIRTWRLWRGEDDPNLIVIEENSQATIVEDYVALPGSESTAFSNTVTELVAGESAVVSHYMIVRESEQSYNVSTLRIQQARSSNVATHSLLLGGALIRNNVHPVLAGEGAECLINGLFMGNGRQHMDN